jgi:hypothetical protein
MKRWLLIGVGFMAAAFLAISWYVVRVLFCNDELGSKVEWSVIQSAASQHPGGSDQKVEIVKLDEYSIVRIPVSDARRGVWIMLNPRSAPYYKQSPAGDYKLSKEDLERIVASGVVITTVENCLESHVGSVTNSSR